jgi:TRAP-type C4-dicarboxylate transport system permease large subunit
MQSHGVNLVWFGVVFVMLACIAGISPPFGLTLFVFNATLGDEVELNDILLGALPFVSLQLLLLAVLIMFPAISLWLPNMMLGK